MSEAKKKRNREYQSLLLGLCYRSDSFGDEKNAVEKGMGKTVFA